MTEKVKYIGPYFTSSSSNALAEALTFAKHEIQQIPYWEVNNVWEKAVPLLEKVMAVQDEWTLEGVKREVSRPAGNTQLWLSPTFALVTQIQGYETGMRKCLLFLCGGEDIEAIRSAQKKVEHWATHYIGCKKMMISGRKGWLKVLNGFHETNTVMEKDLCN